MTGKGQIADHAILANAVGQGCGFGCNVGPHRADAVHLRQHADRRRASCSFYLGEGQFTDDPIPDDFFGCAGVAEIPGLQDVLLHDRLRRATATTSASRRAAWSAPVHEAFEKYLGYDVKAV